MSNESLPTRFIHFLPNRLNMSSEATVMELSSSDLNLNVEPDPDPPRPKTRRAPISSTESDSEVREVSNEAPVLSQDEKLLRATLVANFEGARAQIVNLTQKTKEMSASFDYEREKLIETIDEMGTRIKFLKKENQVQKESYRESLEEIESKSDRVAQQLTNSLIENACLREENCQLREDQVNLTDRVKTLERKLNYLESDQPRVRQILKSLEKREEGLKLQIKRLSQLEAQGPQKQNSRSSRHPSRSHLSEAHYESVTEKARAILRREKINYVNESERKYDKITSTSTSKPKVPVLVSTSNASTSTQEGPDPREEEEEVLRSLFFPF